MPPRCSAGSWARHACKSPTPASRWITTVENSSICHRAGSVARTSESLLEKLQGVVERTYDLDTGVDEIGRFVIGDAGFTRFFGADAQAGRLVSKVASASAGARTLV